MIVSVVEHNIDKDWSYVILALESDGEYRYVHGEVSLESYDISESNLRRLLRKLASIGAATEGLFNNYYYGLIVSL